MRMKSLALLGALLTPVCVLAQQSGSIIKEAGDCVGDDRMVIKTDAGFVLAKHQFGFLMEGEDVKGNLHAMGRQRVRSDSGGGTIDIIKFKVDEKAANKWCDGK